MVMDKKTFDRGREIRSSVLGKEFVDNAFATADGFSSARISSAPCPGARCEYRMVIVIVLWPSQSCTCRSGTPAETS